MAGEAGAARGGEGGALAASERRNLTHLRAAPCATHLGCRSQRSNACLLQLIPAEAGGGRTFGITHARLTRTHLQSALACRQAQVPGSPALAFWVPREASQMQDLKSVPQVRLQSQETKCPF